VCTGRVRLRALFLATGPIFCSAYSRFDFLLASLWWPRSACFSGFAFAASAELPFHSVPRSTPLRDFLLSAWFRSRPMLPALRQKRTLRLEFFMFRYFLSQVLASPACPRSFPCCRFLFVTGRVCRGFAWLRVFGSPPGTGARFLFPPVHADLRY
jgi:hypothetical protein